MRAPVSGHRIRNVSTGDESTLAGAVVDSFYGQRYAMPCPYVATTHALRANSSLYYVQRPRHDEKTHACDRRLHKRVPTRAACCRISLHQLETVDAIGKSAKILHFARCGELSTGQSPSISS